MKHTNEAIEKTQKHERRMIKSWRLLRSNDNNILYSAGVALIFAFMKKPFLSAVSGFMNGYSVSRRKELISDIQTKQDCFIDSYQQMMRQIGISALEDPDVFALTESVADNTLLQEVKTWDKQELAPQSNWWMFWRRSPLSADTRARLEALYEKESQTTDFVYNDVNLSQIGKDCLVRGKRTLREIPNTAEEIISQFRSNR